MKTVTAQLEQLERLQSETTDVYLPVFYRLSNASDREGFNKVLEIPGLSVTDRIYDQVKELLKFRNPGKRFNSEELGELTTVHFGGIDPRVYGVWVYYPWSRRLVHLLDEEEFVDVRTSRNMYKITREERDKLAGKRIGVIGLSVGQSVSVTLAMERVCGEIRLADFDLLELTNLNRIRTGVHNLGLHKVYSVAREIAEIDPFIRVKCFPEGLTEDNMNGFFLDGGRLDLLVEESDGFDIKILSRYKARELGVPVVMEASDRCMVDVERFDLEPERKILHGIVKHLDVETLKSLKTNEEKIPYMLDILGLETTSARLRASMLEMQQTINTWPQLASAVTMGGGITADVSRRVLLNTFTSSGRYYVDVDQLIGNDPGQTSTQELSGHKKEEKELSLDRMKELADKAGKATAVIPEKDIEKILQAAVAAPSQANRQPWKWLHCKGSLFLFHDKVQGLQLLDPDHFNAIVSLGCALENACQQGKELGYESDLTLYPVKKEQELVARIDFKKTAKDPSSLAPFITKRKTQRGPAQKSPLPESIFSELETAVRSIEGAELKFIKGSGKMTELARLVGDCERARLLNESLHREYFSKEIIWSDTGAAQPDQGYTQAALMLPQSLETALKVISAPEVSSLLRQWDKGSAIGNITTLHLAGSPAAGIISMPAGTTEGLLRGGMSAERMWLCAVKNNFAVQPICLPLSFSRRLGKSEIGTTEQNFIDFRALKDRLSLLFEGLQGREEIFLFRLFEAAGPAIPALRKPLLTLSFNC